MPIYEYRCESCGHDLEVLQNMGAPPMSECPACGQAALRKLISAAAFRLKGGGWYETDFKASNRRNLAEAAKEPKREEKADKASPSPATSPAPASSAAEKGKSVGASAAAS